MFDSEFQGSAPQQIQGAGPIRAQIKSFHSQTVPPRGTIFGMVPRHCQGFGNSSNQPLGHGWLLEFPFPGNDGSPY